MKNPSQIFTTRLKWKTITWNQLPRPSTLKLLRPNVLFGLDAIDLSFPELIFIVLVLNFACKVAFQSYPKHVQVRTESIRCY